MDHDQSAQIEDLLSIWYRWQCRQSVAMHAAHFYRPSDHTCREYETPQSEADAYEDAELWSENQTGEQVQLCVDQLTFDHRAAISNSLRNKEIGYSVWSNRGRFDIGESHVVYQAAKESLLPMLSARHLIKEIVAWTVD